MLTKAEDIIGVASQREIPDQNTAHFQHTSWEPVSRPLGLHPRILKEDVGYKMLEGGKEEGFV